VADRLIVLRDGLIAEDSAAVAAGLSTEG
jgi:hypothetical protein